MYVTKNTLSTVWCLVPWFTSLITDSSNVLACRVIQATPTTAATLLSIISIRTFWSIDYIYTRASDKYWYIFHKSIKQQTTAKSVKGDQKSNLEFVDSKFCRPIKGCKKLQPHLLYKKNLGSHCHTHSYMFRWCDCTVRK